MKGVAISKRTRSTLRLVLIYVTAMMIALIFLLPMFWLLSTSLKTRTQIMTEPRFKPIPPRPWQWRNFSDAWTKMPFTLYLRNTVFVTGASVVGTLLTGSMVAYGFGRLRFAGRNVLFALLLSTMMLPGQVTVIPKYLLFFNLGWVNTFMPLIIGSWLGGSAFYVFLMRQFISTIPSELDDAARVDGCSPLGIYWRIILPNMGPAVATTAIFTFVSHWNNLFGALVYLVDQDLWTLARAMVQFRDSFADPTDIYADYHLEWLAAMAILTLLPVLLFYLVFQRYFVRGVALTGIKG